MGFLRKGIFTGKVNMTYVGGIEQDSSLVTGYRNFTEAETRPTIYQCGNISIDQLMVPH